jgi:hypothetical protein
MYLCTPELEENMRFITDVAELKGKTILKATAVDIGESIALIFTDGTCAVFDVEFYGGSHNMVLSADTDDCLKRDAGIITNEEYEERQEAIKAKRAQQAEQRERAELARLKEKYGA